jgi:CMP-N,N'-diacetyllegionaminic acid synthase
VLMRPSVSAEDREAKRWEIVALLTAKGKSTLHNKNILPVKGKPLIYYPATAAMKSQYINAFYVSSDSEAILSIAAGLGYRKILRPDELAQPDSRHVDAILHSLEIMSVLDNYEPDILVVLLGNNVTTKTEWIDRAIKYCMEDPQISAVVPVYNDQEHHPYRAKKLDSSGFLDTFVDFKSRQISTNRQDLEACYYLCHNFWVLNVARSVFSNGGQQPWAFMGNRVKPIIVDECFDVHHEEDISFCDKWLEKNK